MVYDSDVNFKHCIQQVLKFEQSGF